MTIDPVRDALQARPFEPFRLQLADGTDVKITHPECVAFHPKNPRTIHVAMADGGFKKIDLLLVAALHAENGRRRQGNGRRG